MWRFSVDPACFKFTLQMKIQYKLYLFLSGESHTETECIFIRMLLASSSLINKSEIALWLPLCIMSTSTTNKYKDAFYVTMLVEFHLHYVENPDTGFSISSTDFAINSCTFSYYLGASNPGAKFSLRISFGCSSYRVWVIYEQWKTRWDNVVLVQPLTQCKFPNFPNCRMRLFEIRSQICEDERWALIHKPAFK